VRTPAFNLSLDVTPSRQLLAVQIAAHAAAGLCLLLINLPMWWLLGSALLILLHGLYVWWSSRWQQSVRQIRCGAGGFTVVLADGSQCFAAGSGYISTPWLVILSLRENGQRRLLPLFQDSSDADSLRRLRVFLRCKGLQEASGDF
jgi:hypothetical protein